MPSQNHELRTWQNYVCRFGSFRRDVLCTNKLTVAFCELVANAAHKRAEGSLARQIFYRVFVDQISNWRTDSNADLLLGVEVDLGH